MYKNLHKSANIKETKNNNVQPQTAQTSHNSEAKTLNGSVKYRGLENLHFSTDIATYLGNGTT